LLPICGIRIWRVFTIAVLLESSSVVTKTLSTKDEPAPTTYVSSIFLIAFSSRPLTLITTEQSFTDSFVFKTFAITTSLFCNGVFSFGKPSESSLE
jgi:hypothetical protein